MTSQKEEKRFKLVYYCNSIDNDNDEEEEHSLHILSLLENHLNFSLLPETTCP